MTDRWRRKDDHDLRRTPPAEERRQNRPTQPVDSSRPTPASRADEAGLDSGRGFGRIGVSRSDPWSAERGQQDPASRGSATYVRRDDFTGRGPKNYRRRDERILEDVCDRLTDDAMVDASDITVEVGQGEVKLSGTVRDRNQKRRAEDVAERVSGVKDVINAIRIASFPSSGKTGPP